MTATVNLAPPPKLRFFDANGNALVGGLVFTYMAGTTTKQVTYTDSTGGTPNPNPIVLDARGEASIWFDQNLAYKVVLSPAGDTDPPTAPIWTQDNIPPASNLLSAPSSALSVGFQQVGGSARTVAAKLYEFKTSADFPAWGAQCVIAGVNNATSIAFAGSGNVVIGYNNLLSGTTGYANTVVGTNSMQAATTAFYNVALGPQVLQSLTTGNTNNFAGAFAGGFLTTGSSNSGWGDDNQRYATTGSFNDTSGSQALYNNVTGSWNTAHGTYAMRGTANPPDAGPGVGPSPTFCVAIGGQAHYVGSGTQVVSVGYQAGYNSTGSSNTFLGYQAGQPITSGSNNLFAGAGAGTNASQAASTSGLVALGANSWGGTNSVAVGILAAASGNNAIAVGQSASAAGLDSIAIGAGTTASATNAIAIGYGITNSTANTSVFGSSTNGNNFFYGGLQPQTDNAFAIGGPGARWTTVYATTSTINTSDEREKQDIRALNDAELRVAHRLKEQVRTFRWRDAVAKKGDGARLHAGWIAQEVIGAFQAEGLDPFSYGVCCHDDWAERHIHHDTLRDADGNVTRQAYVETVPAGERYGVRHDELLAFIVTAL